MSAMTRARAVTRDIDRVALLQLAATLASALLAGAALAAYGWTPPWLV